MLFKFPRFITGSHKIACKLSIITTIISYGCNVTVLQISTWVDSLDQMGIFATVVVENEISDDNIIYFN